MTSYVPSTLRRLVATRADHLCEYCLIHEDDTFFGCQVEHVIAEKHGGATIADNLAFACVFCNRYKGSDIAGLAPSNGQLVPLFNPRTQRWGDHFALRGVRIEPITPIGEATAAVLRVNASERILEREALANVNRYPNATARARLAAP